MSNHRSSPQGRAEDALSDINMFTAIQVLTESSLFRTRLGNARARKIEKICREGAQVALRELDRARGEAK